MREPRLGYGVSPASWHFYRGARVSLVVNEDATFSPRIAKVTLHSAGMLVERRIPVPANVAAARFATRDAAAKAALDALDLGTAIAV
jgi:hypothetical protein